MRLWATVVLLGVMAAACGGDATVAPTTTIAATTTSAATPTIPATTTSAPTPTIPAITTTLPQPPGEHSRQIPVPDRSVLGLALEPGDMRPGRFRLEPGPQTMTLMAVEGRYWVNHLGDVYTALDVDPELIAEQMGILTAAIEGAGGHSPGSPYLTSLREHYRGDEFQIGMADLVRSLAAGGLPAEWAEQWSWFIQADGNPVPPELSDCRNAITSLDRAVRQWFRDLEIEFVDGIWVFPVAAFEEAVAVQIAEASICEMFVEVPGPSPEILVARVGEAGLRRVEVFVDDKTYTDREPELMFAIVMWPDESVGPPPDDPDPAPLLTLRGSYLTAIGVCGELPWIYSNFAAADTYYAPATGGYNGPLVFASGWYCQDEVPSERRREGG